MIKYLRDSENIQDCLTTDELGNRIHKEDGSYVIVVPKTREVIERSPIPLVKVNNQWIPKQMEFDFGQMG
jgi:hypothetical protein